MQEKQEKKRFLGLSRPKPERIKFDPDLLCDLIRALGHDPDTIGINDLQAVANKLSVVAKHEPAWGWRYLRNVLNRKIEASKLLADAVMRVGAMIDNTPAELATSERVTVQALGKVRPGALVLTDSRPCANPACQIEFVPRTPNQKCHSARCRMMLRKLIGRNNGRLE